MSQPCGLSPAIAPAFTRATLDRNMTVNTTSFERALAQLDLSDMAVLDFGCGTGNLVRLLRHTNAKIIYAFEVMPEHLAPDILDWVDDPTATPRLILNPADFKIYADAADGDLTAYDYFRLLGQHEKFAIISNPPYFLYNRILSLTGNNLAAENQDYRQLAEKFAGALMITSKGRLHNHPHWDILAILEGSDFNPPAYGQQYLIQTGFADRTPITRENQPHITGKPQSYPPITNREPLADATDHYPEMWAQLEKLAQQKSKNRPKSYPA